MRILLAFAMVFLGAVAPARADTPPTESGVNLVTVKEVTEQVLPKKDTSKEKEAEDEEQRRKKEKIARVIVLKWNGKSVDYTNENLQRNVRSRIVRPDAQFFPDVDLYQNGRKVRDRTVEPGMQPAVVPTQNISRVMDAVDEIAARPERSMSTEQWRDAAKRLKEMIDLLWFVDREELREPLFLLYAQIGRAADYMNTGQPPFFEEIGEQGVNYYFYLAAVLAYQDPALMSKLTDDEVRAYVDSILSGLKSGQYPTFTLDFQLVEEDGDFDLDKFSAMYSVYLNGLELTDINEQGQYQVFFGRNDINLVRKDSGFGLSERLEATKLEDKIYFVRDTARKKMGLDFIRQLFDHENECLPALDGDILNFLSIYARIHPKAEVYVAAPKYGSPNKVYIWRYDRPTARLMFVEGGSDGFPVRLAVLTSVGVMYDGLGPPQFNDSVITTPTDDPTSIDPTSLASITPSAGFIPWDFQLRGHYNRLMVEIGMEAGFSTGSAEDGTGWAERYWLPGHNDDGVVIADANAFNSSDTTVTAWDTTKQFNSQGINRLLYIQPAVMLGKDSGIGLGPHLGLAVGYTNLPRAVQTMAHAGWTLMVPGVEDPEDRGRVRPILDVDLRGGGQWPTKNSVYFNDEKAVTFKPLFGFTAGLGTTF